MLVGAVWTGGWRGSMNTRLCPTILMLPVGAELRAWGSFSAKPMGVDDQFRGEVRGRC